MDKDDFSKKKGGKGGKSPGKEPSGGTEEKKGGGLAGGRFERKDDDAQAAKPGKMAAGKQPAAKPAKVGSAAASAAGALAAASVPDPERDSKLAALKSKIAGFEDDVRLRDANREFSSIENTITKLPSEVEKVRSRGYAFRSYLENKAKVINEQWQDIRQRAERTIEDESAGLRRNLDEINQMLSRVEQSGDGLSGLDSMVERLENKVESAKGSIKDMYTTLRDDANNMTSQLRDINWICDRKDEASFDFFSGESVFLAAEAEWDDGGDKPKGFIFLTDQRLAFEQKQKVGKKFGMFGGKEVHEKLWEATMAQVEAVEAENKGMMGGRDMLHFTLGGGASYAKITVEVKGSADNKDWQKQIQRIISGDVNDERAIEPDPELIERLRNAPTECHVCGGMLPQIVAGQNQVECQYCGSVVRL
jgi:archaellum component FlaC